jgi:hypothetical protein
MREKLLAKARRTARLIEARVRRALGTTATAPWPTGGT